MKTFLVKIHFLINCAFGLRLVNQNQRLVSRSIESTMLEVSIACASIPMRPLHASLKLTEHRYACAEKEILLTKYTDPQFAIN